MFTEIKSLFGIGVSPKKYAQNSVFTLRSEPLSTETEKLPTPLVSPQSVPESPVSDFMPAFFQLSASISQTVDSLKRTTEEVVSSVSVSKLASDASLVHENIAGFYEPVPELKMYQENFAAGSGILFKYTNHLNRISRTNKVLGDKGEKSHISIKKSVFNVLLAHNELNNFNTLIHKLPSVLAEVDLLNKKIDIVCDKITAVCSFLDEF